MANRRIMQSKAEFQNYISSLISESELAAKLYLPDLEDLYSLYANVRKNKSTAIVEYGSGWSTLALALAIYENKVSDGNYYLENVRHPNPYQLMTVDASSKFQAIAMKRIPKELAELILPVVSPCHIGTFEDKICSYFTDVPSFIADFIYLDGPDCDQVLGEIGGFNFNFGSDSHRYGLPMSGDLLRLEYFMWPGTRIVVDGRGANAAFLKNHFSRNWKYEYKIKLDQHLFVLRDPAWGRNSQLHLDATS